MYTFNNRMMAFIVSLIIRKAIISCYEGTNAGRNRNREVSSYKGIVLKGKKHSLLDSLPITGFLFPV